MTNQLLGNRLLTICEALMQNKNNDACSIFGSPDDMKLLSCMTLFSSAKNAHPVFIEVAEKFFGGAKDDRTLRIINAAI